MSETTTDIARPDSGREAPADVDPQAWSALRSCGTLAEASDEGVAWLARLSKVRSYPKGERIPCMHDSQHEIGIVIQGHVRAVPSATTGDLSR